MKENLLAGSGRKTRHVGGHKRPTVPPGNGETLRRSLLQRLTGCGVAGCCDKVRQRLFE